MSKVLFLDDRQERIDVAEEIYKDHELTIVRTAEDAICELASMVSGARSLTTHMYQGWDMVCLDHDLNGEGFVNTRRSDCGMEVVRWMTAYRGPLNKIAKKVIVHSSNLYAALEMYSALQNRGYNVLYERFRYE